VVAQAGLDFLEEAFDFIDFRDGAFSDF